MESILSFAIIIPVIHSLDDLKRCLSSLEHLDYPKERFHVVLIDCHVFSGLEQFFGEDLQKYKIQVSTLCLPEQPLNKLNWLIEARINEARNTAIQRFPAQYYVFTEDDCMFKPDWLDKFEGAFTDKIGIVGGPDILPEGLEWFPRTVDCLLNCYLGTAGMRSGAGRTKEVYSSKENMAIPAWVFDRIGHFSEEHPIAGEMEFAGRVRNAGLQVRFIHNNPVLHRRVTTYRNFFRLTAYMASCKLRLLLKQRKFMYSMYFFLLLAVVLGFTVAMVSIFSNYARIFLFTLVGIYLVALFATMVSCIIQTRSLSVGLGILLLMPFHHLSITYGTIRGIVTRDDH